MPGRGAHPRSGDRVTLPRRPRTTARLRLEPLGPGHIDAAYAAIDSSRPELRPWMPWAEIDLDGEAEFLRGVEAAWDAGREYTYAMIQDGRFAGAAGLHVSTHLRWTGSIGYWVRSDAAGQGLATEAAADLVTLAFGELELQRLTILAGVDNTASQRVAEKLGFRREGLARAAAFGERGPYDCVIFGLVRSDPGSSASPGPGGVEGERSTPDFSRGLVTAVAQDAEDGTVLMLAHMDAEAYRRTLNTGHAWFWSRSRGELWEKGATSGNYLDVVSVTLDCDGDAVLLRVRPHGPACHTGARSCFHNDVATGGPREA